LKQQVRVLGHIKNNYDEEIVLSFPESMSPFLFGCFMGVLRLVVCMLATSRRQMAFSNECLIWSFTNFYIKTPMHPIIIPQNQLQNTTIPTTMSLIKIKPLLNLTYGVSVVSC
jgi:hypothetical protein